MKTVSLADIVFDAGTQIRAAINDDVVTDYAERLSEGVMFPPVILFHDGSQYYMADGFHRALASQRVGATKISADVQAGTKSDALWFALGANRTNGQRLTPKDKKHAIKLALETWPQRSSRTIAEQVGCDDGFVRRIKEQVVTSHHLPMPDRVTGKDGKSYPATRQSEPKAHPKTDEILQRIKSGETATQVAKALKIAPETVQKVRRASGEKWIDKSRSAVAERRAKMREMAGDGYSSRQIAAALGMNLEGCRETLKHEQIDVPADRAIGNTKHHDANRIIEQMVMDAENLTADVNLIEFDELDSERIGEWLDALTKAHQSLKSFIRRLTQEHKKHGEAA